MFTGIIKNTGKIVNIRKINKGFEIEILSNFVLKKKDIGTSISVNGACLTLTKFIKKKIFFFISYKTYEITNFKYLKKNNFVNLERSLKFGDEIAGHFVQGHVDTTGKVISVKKLMKTWTIVISLPANFNSFLVDRGSICINGVSLTIVKVKKNTFSLVVIPHTLKITNIINLNKGDTVNVEIDIVIKYLNSLNNK
ncbi:MAG: riboflavin synthase [Pelagibacteraceae bacterium]